MNLALLGLTVIVVVLVLGTAFWLIATLGPLHRKQKMRRTERLTPQADQRETRIEAKGQSQEKVQGEEHGNAPKQKDAR